MPVVKIGTFLFVRYALALPGIVCYTYHRKTEYDSRCLFVRFAAQERVKGKRVQIPHDLVTVIREPAARVHLHQSLGLAREGGGRR